MKNRSLLAVALGLCMVVALGGLYASNMGFKLNKGLVGISPTSVSGTQSIALPYNPQTSITDAAQLFADINATAGTNAVTQITRFNTSPAFNGGDTGTNYNGFVAADNFPIDGAQEYRIQMSQNVNYIIVGSHDPGRVIELGGVGTGADTVSGTYAFSYPYHSTAAMASDLFDDINLQGGDVVTQITRFNTSGDTGTNYNGFVVADDFALEPGVGYRVQIKPGQQVSYVPSHY